MMSCQQQDRAAAVPVTMATMRMDGLVVAELLAGDPKRASRRVDPGRARFEPLRRSSVPAAAPRLASRVPLADGTLVKAPVGEDSDLMASLLTLSDVFGTGYHAALKGGVTKGSTVTVIGDGAVGLLAVLSAKQLGAEQIVLMGRHPDRTALGREFGATDVVAERGEDGIERVRELTGGYGSQIVLEAVGYMPAYEQAIGVVRPGGVISRVGVPQYEEAPIGFGSLFGPNVTLTGGPAPARAYIHTLRPAILDGAVEPGKVFDRTVTLEDTADGYQAMNERAALKVLVRP